MCLSVSVLKSQIVADTFYIPNYPIPEIYYTDDAPELPDSVWNHKLKYFPPWFYDQDLPNCGQASAVYNCMTYEFNRALDRLADSSTIFAPTYSYNFQSEGNGWYGVSSFNSWNLIKSQGNPVLNVFDEMAFEDTTNGEPVYNGTYMMSGYDNYYSSFRNRISDYYSLDVSTDEDLRILMHYFDDHLRGEETGGTAIFYSNSYFMHTGTTPTITDSVLCDPNAKVKVISYIAGQPTHSMTIVGYYKNTTIDFNGDGLITDTVDINLDHIVDRHDNEKILWIVINSYGDYWPTSMFLFKYDLPERFWNKQVFLPVPDTAYNPELCFKIRLKHSWRNSLKISAGISSDPQSDIPEKIIDFPVFNFQGGHHVMTGRDTVLGADVMEFGIDITDILQHIELTGDSKVFLIIENSGGDDGELQYFSLIKYENGAESEVVGTDSYFIIPAATVSYFPVTMPLYSDPQDTVLRLVVPEDIVEITGNNISVEIAGQGGTPPYNFNVVESEEYSQEYLVVDYEQLGGLSFSRDTLTTIYPGWKIPFGGELWDSLYVGSDATISFTGQNGLRPELYPYPEIKTSLYKDCQIDVFDTYYFQDPVLYAYSTHDTCIDIWFNDSLYTEFMCKASIFKDGRIQLTYRNVENYPQRTAGLRTKTASYYSGLCSEGVSQHKNSVIYHPETGNNSISVSEDGIVTILGNDEVGEKLVYIQVTDSKGGKATKAVRYEILSTETFGTVYPNPFINYAYLDVNTKEACELNMKIFNISGQIVGQKIMELTPGKTTITVSASEFNLKSGVYTCLLNLGNVSEIVRIVVI